jgi:hypothetical protein
VYITPIAFGAGMLVVGTALVVRGNLLDRRGSSVPHWITAKARLLGWTFVVIGASAFTGGLAGLVFS